jgi:hypothetical protein
MPPAISSGVYTEQRSYFNNVHIYDENTWELVEALENLYSLKFKIARAE